MKPQHFVTELIEGHKGAAVLVPFDPAKTWGTQAVEHGVLPWRKGHLVKGAINGAKFEGWIGNRWGRFFILVDEELQRAARTRVGALVEVVVEPRTEADSPTRPTPKRPAKKSTSRRKRS